MRITGAFVLLVIGFLIVAAVSLLPRPEEHLATLADEGRHREVLALLERQLAKSPRAPNLLAAVARSSAALGDYGRAAQILDAYLAMRPDDLAARERQADLLLQNGSIERYLDALSRLVAARPSPGGVTRLVELYRLHGRADDELAILRTYADRAMLDPAQLERLGAILAERAQWREARRWLELADRNAPPEATAGRLLLLDVLIESNETDEAYERAQMWMKAWRSPFLSGKLTVRMAQGGIAGSASQLAKASAELMPDHVFDIAGLLVRKGQQDLARQMLAHWAERATHPTGLQWRAFIAASLFAGDVHGPLAKLAQLMRSGANPALQARLTEEWGHTMGMSAVAPIRPWLSNKVLLARPLFAAELALFEGNRELARWFLTRTEPAQLSSEQMTTWLALLQRVEEDAKVFARLLVLRDDGRLPMELVPALADIALKVGQPRLHAVIWDSMRR